MCAQEPRSGFDIPDDRNGAGCVKSWADSLGKTVPESVRERKFFPFLSGTNFLGTNFPKLTGN